MLEDAGEDEDIIMVVTQESQLPKNVTRRKPWNRKIKWKVSCKNQESQSTSYDVVT